MSFDKMASFNIQTVVFLRTYTSVFMRLQHLTTAQNIIKRHNHNVTVIFLSELSENGDFDKGSNIRSSYTSLWTSTSLV